MLHSIGGSGKDRTAAPKIRKRGKVGASLTVNIELFEALLEFPCASGDAGGGGEG